MGRAEMPINEQVVDALAHIMRHFYVDYPEAQGEYPTAEELALYARSNGACEQCCARFAATVGAKTFAAAIEAVWDSEVWDAFVTREGEAEED
jgi:hypothetical protein